MSNSLTQQFKDFMKSDDEKCLLTSEETLNFDKLTVGDAIKLNERERRKMRKRIDWDKVLICGVSLGFMASTLYLLMAIALSVAQ